MNIYFVLTLTTVFSSYVRVSHAVTCQTTQYPPNSSAIVPRYIVDLDLPPDQRWTQLAKDKAKYMGAIFDDVKQIMKSILGKRGFSFLIRELDKIAKTLPDHYYKELQGIATASGFPLSYITLYNIFYEAFVLCTSIIVQDPSGEIYIGRNLDNGALLGWDAKNHQWFVSEQLRHLSVHLEWRRNGTVVFESVGFAGYIGVLTAVKKGAFSFSLNKRMSWNNGMIGLFEWLVLGDHDQNWVTLLSREVLEEASTFEEAKGVLSSRRLLAPVYYILAGTKEKEGVIITRFRDNVDFLPLGSSKAHNDPWFLVQTNYDHWSNPPFFDDRRDPAKQCIVQQMEDKLSTLHGLANVLSTIPVLNLGTVYTALMHAKSGQLVAWRQECKSIYCPPI